jgi:hypothetical protein
MLHKDLNNFIHDDMNGEALHRLPAGCIPITDEEAAMLKAPPPPTSEQLLKAIEQAIEKHMDEVAQADGWDNRWSCMARAGYVKPWQAKAIKYAQWVDECWIDSFQAQADIEAGLRAIPTPEQAVLELPEMVWPV